MVNIWGALASEDIRLLKSQTEAFLSLPEHSAFVNYVRCHDDIGWGFDESKETELGIDPLLHKIFQYRFWSGEFPGSYACGGLYNYDAKTLDARTVGTTASLVGLESAKDAKDREMAIRRFRLIYATVFALKGLPLINSVSTDDSPENTFLISCIKILDSIAIEERERDHTDNSLCASIHQLTHCDNHRTAGCNHVISHQYSLAFDITKEVDALDISIFRIAGND